MVLQSSASSLRESSLWLVNKIFIQAATTESATHEGCRGDYFSNHTVAAVKKLIIFVFKFVNCDCATPDADRGPANPSPV